MLSSLLWVEPDTAPLPLPVSPWDSCNFPEATLVSECERTWLFLRMPCGADDCPSEKLDRRNRPRPQLPPPLAPCSPREETESSFWELLEEKRLELLLLLLLVLALLQARPRRPKFPMARYSGPSFASLCASSWLPVQVSSLWLVVLELISLAGEKGSLGEGTRELGCSREVLPSLKEEDRVAGQCSWGWLVLEQTEELAGLLSGRPDEAGWGRLEKDPQWRCCTQPADGAYGDPGRAVRLWLFVTGDGPSPLLVSRLSAR